MSFCRRDKPLKPALFFTTPGAEHLAPAFRSAGLADGACVFRKFPDGDSYVRLLGDVAGRRTVLVSALNDPDEHLMGALLHALVALKNSGWPYHTSHTCARIMLSMRGGRSVPVLDGQDSGRLSRIIFAYGQMLEQAFKKIRLCCDHRAISQADVKTVHERREMHVMRERAAGFAEPYWPVRAALHDRTVHGGQFIRIKIAQDA